MVTRFPGDMCNGKDIAQCGDKIQDQKQKMIDNLWLWKTNSNCTNTSDIVCMRSYFLAKLIFMAVVGVILKPCSASLAAADCISDSNSTKAMS